MKMKVGSFYLLQIPYPKWMETSYYERIFNYSKVKLLSINNEDDTVVVKVANRQRAFSTSGKYLKKFQRNKNKKLKLEDKFFNKKLYMKIYPDTDVYNSSAYSCRELVADSVRIECLMKKYVKDVQGLSLMLYSDLAVTQNQMKHRLKELNFMTHILLDVPLTIATGEKHLSKVVILNDINYLVKVNKYTLLSSYISFSFISGIIRTIFNIYRCNGVRIQKLFNENFDNKMVIEAIKNNDKAVLVKILKKAFRILSVLSDGHYGGINRMHSYRLPVWRKGYKTIIDIICNENPFTKKLDKKQWNNVRFGWEKLVDHYLL
jgi:hypothetical protein